MRDVTTIIDGIHAVRQARRQFLRFWRLEGLPACLAAAPSALDRLAADIARTGKSSPGGLAADLTTTQERTFLKTRTTWLYPHGRMADEWE